MRRTPGYNGAVLAERNVRDTLQLQSQATAVCILYKAMFSPHKIGLLKQFDKFVDYGFILF